MITIRYNKVTLKTDEDVYIYPIGDIHIGHMNADVEGLKKYLNKIPHTPNHRILLMGDLMDCGIKSAIGGSAYEQNIPPGEQLTMIECIFEPFAENEQIDACVMGNHEYRIYKEVGVDMLSLFCSELEIPYMLYSGVVTYSINGDRAYNINMFHGKAGGGLENALRACKTMANKVTADVYLMGHCHHKSHSERIMKYVDSRNRKLTEQKQHFVLTGHMLKYDDSYADQANLEISPQGFPVIKLSASGDKGVFVY